MSKRYQAAILTASYNGLQVPNAPTIGTATSGGLSASVTFTAPSNIGGGAITSYTAISSPGGITGVGASSPVTVSGLTSGVSYTFTVVANNVYGAGPASAASNSITAVDPSAFIENLFSTYLYTGNGTSQSIVNGIDVSTYGGMTWIKNRSTDTGLSVVHDTARGTTQRLSTNLTDAQVNLTGGIGLTAFNSNGFTVGTGTAYNGSGNNLASWTFRKQAKFFDIVTYTGSGTNRTISHNLGSVPGCIIVKDISTSNGYWAVYHRSTGANYFTYLNDTSAASTGSTYWNNTSPTSTVFTVGTNADVNASGVSYVAYIFAHDAGGFGTSGTDNVISCGSFTTGSGGKISAPVNLGYEAQWLLAKNVGSAENWVMYDIMRGMNNTGYAALNPNTSGAEYTGTSAISPTATGFDTPNASGPFANSATYIYIAIRRGPMAVPTLGTSVFAPVTYTGDNTSTKQLTSGFPIDLIIGGDRSSPPSNVFDRLRGVSSASPVSYTASTADEQSSVYGILGMTYLQTGDGTVRYQNSTGVNYVDYFFRRAPSFFDEVCYTGTGSATTQTHNLGVVPELMMVKARSSSTYNWQVYHSALGNSQAICTNLDIAAYSTVTQWNATTPTSTVFSIGSSGATNVSGVTYVAYLFATCAGVSKVGSYTGTATTLQVDCGFTGGARFVLIKRTDSTGDWYVWDSARGIVSGNDPYLLLNSTAAEVTNTDYVDTYTAGFEISSTAPAAINASGGTYIYLAIA